MLRDYPHDNILKVDYLIDSAKGYLSSHDNSRSIQTRIELVLTEMFGPPSLEIFGGSLVYRIQSLRELRRRFENFMGSAVSWGIQTH